jgi:3-keto-disaccharide hydrolase
MRYTLGVMSVAICAAATVLGTALIAQAPASGGQQPPAGQTPAAGQPQGRGEGRGQGRGGPRGAQPLNFEDRTGFQSIFDGTMKNWDGDTAIWKAEGNVLVGTTTAENPLKENTFVIWRGGEPADFELKVEYRMSSTNSGIQFRSAHLPQGSPAPTRDDPNAKIAGKWVLKGYQADIDFANQFTGMIYEERGRGFLMVRGQAVEIGPDGVSRQIGNLEMTADELKSLIKPGEWNTVHLIARGNTIMNIVNGHVTAYIVDDDTKGRALKGLLGFQIHVGPPMKIEFRNIYLKSL